MSFASLQRLILHLGVVIALALPLAAQTPSSSAVLAPDAGPTSWNAGPYSYDASGNIIGIGGGYGNQSFRYDVNGRLVTSTITGPLGSTSEQFSYDAYANMLSHTVDGTTTSYPTTSSTNHLTSGINAAYDEAGNLTQWQPPGTAVVYHYSFDALHMMTESNATNTSGGAYSGAHRVIHIYTADDERAWTYDLTANESHWRIRGLDSKVLRDFDNAGTTWTAARDYLYRDGALLGAITPSGSEHYTLDHLGTPRFITDGSGNQIGLHTYRPFGQEWSVTDPTQEGNPLRFTGHERDADSLAGGANGLDYMHARFYDGPVGRFLTVDPVGGTGPAPLSFNRYAYADNDPLTRTDPTGMFADDGHGTRFNAPVPGVDDGGGGGPYAHDTTAKESVSDLEQWWIVYGYAFQFVYGFGPTQRVFVPNSREVADMMKSPMLQRAYAEFLRLNVGRGVEGKPLLPYSIWPRFGIRGLIQAGLNPTQQFVGGHRITITPVPGGKIRFTLMNPTSFHSLMFDIGPEWERQDGAGFMHMPYSTVYQTYTWTAPAPRP